MQRGFSLIETIIATGLVVAALVTLAQLLAVATQAGAAARTRTTSTILAASKMEELRGRPWDTVLAEGRDVLEYFDSEGTRVCEVAAPCGRAAYVCRWSAARAPFNALVLLIEVEVAAVGTRAGGATLVTATGRKQ